MIDITCLEINIKIFHSVTCLGCQEASNRAFSEAIIPIERASQSIQNGVQNYFDPEIVEDYNCDMYVRRNSMDSF